MSFKRLVKEGGITDEEKNNQKGRRKVQHRTESEKSYKELLMGGKD